MAYSHLILPLKNAGYEFNSSEELHEFARKRITEIVHHSDNGIYIHYYLGYQENSEHPIDVYFVPRR